MARYGMGRRGSTVWRFLPREPSRRKFAVGYRETPTTLIADTSKLRYTVSSLRRSTCRTAIRSPARSSITSSLGSSDSFNTLLNCATAADPVILAGDYNVVPTDAVADIYSAKSWKDDALLQPETRDAYRRLLEQGWTDAIHMLHPDAPMYTFWDYFRNRWERNSGLRIDHLLLNDKAAVRLKEAGVDREVRGRVKPSDHAPAWVVLAQLKSDVSVIALQNKAPLKKRGRRFRRSRHNPMVRNA